MVYYSTDYWGKTEEIELFPGTYTVSASHRFYKTTTATVKLHPGERIVPFVVLLEPEYPTIKINAHNIAHFASIWALIEQPLKQTIILTPEAMKKSGIVIVEHTIPEDVMWIEWASSKYPRLHKLGRTLTKWGERGSEFAPKITKFVTKITVVVGVAGEVSYAVEKFDIPEHIASLDEFANSLSKTNTDMEKINRTSAELSEAIQLNNALLALEKAGLIGDISEKAVLNSVDTASSAAVVNRTWYRYVQELNGTLSSYPDIIDPSTGILTESTVDALELANFSDEEIADLQSNLSYIYETRNNLTNVTLFWSDAEAIFEDAISGFIYSSLVALDTQVKIKTLWLTESIRTPTPEELAYLESLENSLNASIENGDWVNAYALSIELANYTRKLTLATNNESFEDNYIQALWSLADSKKMLVAHIFAKVDEEINATFNQDGTLIEKIAVGNLTLVNEEDFAFPNSTVTLSETNLTTISPTIFVPTLEPGDTSIAQYNITVEPEVHLSESWENYASVDNQTIPMGHRILAVENNTMIFNITIENTANHSINWTVLEHPVPKNITNITIISPSSVWYNFFEDLIVLDSLPANSTVSLIIQGTFNATAIDSTWVDLSKNTTLRYSDTGKTYSELEVSNVTGVEPYQAKYMWYDAATSSNIFLIDSTLENVPVIKELVLSWVTDDSNEWFIDELAKMKPEASFTIVNNKSEFFSELENNFYNVILLANTKWNEELTDTEIEEIRNTIYQGSSIGRGLIMSGFALKYAPELGEILGDKYIGSLPMGKPFDIRKVTVAENHYITEGYLNEELASTGWAVKVVPEESTPLAYFEDIMPGKAKGKPLKLKKLPALTVSTYGNGSGILFAPDVGRSTKEDISKDEWLDIASRAIDWIFVTTIEK